MNRSLTTLIAAAAILLGGAATASANVPMRIVAESPSVFSMQDEESWSTDYYKWNFAGTTIATLPAGNGTFNFKYVRCLGGEVRAELFIEGYRWSNQEHATLTGHIDLYEGASCATKDLDGQSDFEKLTIKIGGGSPTLYIPVKNWEEDAEDGAWALFQLRALPL